MFVCAIADGPQMVNVCCVTLSCNDGVVMFFQARKINECFERRFQNDSTTMVFRSSICCSCEGKPHEGKLKALFISFAHCLAAYQEIDLHLLVNRSVGILKLLESSIWLDKSKIQKIWGRTCKGFSMVVGKCGPVWWGFLEIHLHCLSFEVEIESS